MRTRVLLVTALVLVAAVAMGCQPIPMAQPQIIVVTATPAPEPPAELPIALTVVGPSETVDLTLGGLKGLTAVEGWAGLKSSTGKIYPPAQYQGVSLQELAALVGGLDESLAITVEAEDGYAMTFSYAQIMDGAFVTFDPGTGDEKEIEDSLTVLVAYERDGEPLPEKSDGTLRLVIVNDSGGQVTDGHWAVKWVRKVTLKPVVAEWFLRLEGALVEDMDRGTFESGSAPGCHGESWTDSDGHVWTGIPLWLLVGRVDDERKHDRRAFNEQLAEEGYTIEVIASDGFSATFESQRIAFDDTIIVAYLMDDAALTEKDWPLRLVGPELSKREQVGGIAQIVLSVPAAAEGAGEPEASP
ncbi:MAG: hypothetical protein FJZ90_13220, partial [Chloroflexi bacterium]|nr:hypothetical protein [Chloroflexota bacterium]